MDGMKQMRDEATERQKAEDVAKATADAQAAAEKLVTDTEVRMRDNFSVFYRRHGTFSPRKSGRNWPARTPRRC